MFKKNPLLLVLSFGFVASVTPFRRIRDSASELSATPNIVKPALLSNASVPALNASAENAISIHCDGETYGYNPNIRDCEDAKENLTPDMTLWTFGQRHTDLPVDTVPLPYRVMGDRGLCYFQTILLGDYTTGMASLNMLRRAATSLVIQCATNSVSQGGIATNIGGDNKLAVILGEYRRPVTCHGIMPSWGSCRYTLQDMDADKLSQTFGPHTDPSVTEVLPHRILSPDLECSTTIFSNGNSDVSSYYEIWEAATAIYSVCARHRHAGSLRGLGEHGNIFLTTTTNWRFELPSNSSGVQTIES